MRDGAGFTAKDRADIEAVTRRAEAIACGSQDWSEYASVFYAADAVFMPPNAKAVRGCDAIARFITDNYPGVRSVKYETVDMEGCDGLAYVYGRYRLESSDSGGTATDVGKFIEVWRRQRGGGWQISLDIFNSDLAEE